MSDAAAPVPYRSSPRRWAFLAAALVIAVLPLVLTGNYWQTNLTVCAINVLLALGLDFILGYAGQLNLGQSAFYGLGGYVSTLLITKLGVPFWAAFAAGVAFAGLAGMILALFAVRLRGHYLAIASLGFAVIVHQILLNWISLTQGPLGIYAIPPPPAIAIPGLPVIDFRNPVALFYLVAGFALLTYFILDQIVRSPIGETLTAIREDEISAVSLGINAAAWKVFAFGVGAASGISRSRRNACQNSCGMGRLIFVTASCQWSTLLTPANTTSIAGWASGNCNAAARSGTP